jgi:outer membrane cobalamin receptor
VSVHLSFQRVIAHVAGAIPAVSVMAIMGGLPVTALGAPADPQAQTVGASNSSTAASASGTTLQEVVVTGTSIAGGNAQQALPVQILNAADIARTGAVSVPELMQQVSAVDSVGSTQPAQGTGYTTGGIATVSLHGLGSDRTLVLINGLRSTLYGGT